MAAHVVVGFDGSPNSTQAIEWATQEANARGADLRVIDTTTSVANPYDELIDAAENADLLVLAIDEASTGRAALRRSIARAASRTSPCPVVVVRGHTHGAIQRIVGATDTSSAAAAGLVLAAREAALHEAELVVVYVRDQHGDPLDAQFIVDLAVKECLAHRACRVTGVVLDGDPANALAEASGDADLLVIGSRGRSGFKTMLFGSVAESLVDRAHCPVLVTHPRPHIACTA